MAGLCEGGNEPPGSLKANNESDVENSSKSVKLMLKAHSYMVVTYEEELRPGKVLEVRNNGAVVSCIIHQEAHCLAKDGNSRRVYIIAIDRGNDRAIIIDPTVHFETAVEQPGRGRQHSLKCAKGKRCRSVCTVVQQEEVESIPASSYECTISALCFPRTSTIRGRSSTWSTGVAYTTVFRCLHKKSSGLRLVMLLVMGPDLDNQSVTKCCRQLLPCHKT
ncbi:hypothetical protein ANN_10150 [Periplaneta americana]|uniref:Uncharacterized protein n=1 Tax=Periplaneta americana TaxID=6978 RepID=A0ABQ8TN92_PERAM|nr:hypothetical protein ANN_10150 [Periplaneta americana]